MSSQRPAAGIETQYGAASSNVTPHRDGVAAASVPAPSRALRRGIGAAQRSGSAPAAAGKSSSARLHVARAFAR